ncbi:uncharacterized protein LOC112350624 [Selaginella moellendorffii]|uniref:uncharacterized protein LOC112350624 n=1 Tax=Selaginella moellendorffii TaxID=88036 RepID=UPI000D1C85A4|nr:uncharacterized protein LOC112350624 [Selaginella moellendorffii]|eukprot:XP_024542874.1 uncharacterized protein LOC112350624 [Selaginella moellendorffii]
MIRRLCRSEHFKALFSTLFAMMLGIFIGITFSESSFFLSMRSMMEDCRKPVICKAAGTETLPPTIVEGQTDLFLRRLWGNPEEDLPFKPRYLLTLTVGSNQMEMVDKAVSKKKVWGVVSCIVLPPLEMTPEEEVALSLTD